MASSPSTASATSTSSLVPFIEVSRLAASTSFYSAVTQPIGLRYLSVQGGQPGHAARAVTFGIGPLQANAGAPVFQVREVADESRSPRLTHVVFAASSPEVVRDFYAIALRANPELADIPGSHSIHVSAPAAANPSAEEFGTGGGGEARASVQDLDGSTMEVVYVPPRGYPPGYAGSTVRRTNSRPEEVDRILSWNYKVASSSVPQPETYETALATQRRGSLPESLPILTRTITTSVSEVPQPQPAQPSSSATAIVGSLLGAAVGAAAGAALTYTVMRNDRDRVPVPVPEYVAPQQYGQRALPPQDPTYQSGVMTHKPRRYVEVERTVEKVRYPEAYAPLLLANGSASTTVSRSPPQYIAKYSQVGSSAHRSREADDAYDGRSRHSSRQSSHAGSRARTRSEAPSATRNPFLLTEYQHQSPPGSVQASSTASSQHSRSRHHHSITDYERPSVATAAPSYAPSYAPSTRSQRSESTVRQHAPTVVRSTVTSRGPPTAVHAASVHSKSIHAPSVHASSIHPSTVHAPSVHASSVHPSTVHAPSVHASTVHAPSVHASSMHGSSAAPGTRVQSHVSARNVALPPSRADGASTVYSARDYDWAPQPSTVVRAARPSRPPITGVPAAASRSASYISARNVGLPTSRAGSRYTARDEEDDGDSIAPSDSISCVASRRSAKSYYG